MIPQDPFLFSGTVRENLDPGRRHKDTEIKRSLSRCNMLEMVELLGGLEAKIEERGQQFSSGQRQLLCLARTMLSASHVSVNKLPLFTTWFIIVIIKKIKA